MNIRNSFKAAKDIKCISTVILKKNFLQSSGYYSLYFEYLTKECSIPLVTDKKKKKKKRTTPLNT